MGWLEGLVSGVTERQREIEKDKLAQWEQANARESSLFTTILQHSNDPKLRSMAATGLLTASQAPKRRGGFLGYLGDLEANPLTGRIQEFLQTPQPYEEEVITRGLPSQQSLPTVPPPTGGAALPTTQTTTPGAPAPTPTQPTPPATPPAPATPPPTPPPPQAAAPPPTNVAGVYTQPGLASANAVYGATDTGGFATPPPGILSMGAPRNVAAPAGVETRTSMRVPELFPTAGEQAITARRSQIQGDFQALRDMYIESGLPRLQATQQAAQDVLAFHARAGLRSQSIELQYTDPNGQLVRALGTYDPTSQRYYDSRGNMITDPNVRRTPAASLQTGGTVYNQALNNLSLTYLDVQTDPAAAARVRAEVDRLVEEQASGLVTARAGAAAAAPLSTNAQVDTVQQLQQRWSTIRTPVTNMETYLRIMQAEYQRYKAGDKTAWEPLRTAFVKISEPNSVVMPSEFARNSGVASIMDRIYGTVQQAIVGGAPLPDALIDQMMGGAQSMWQSVQTYGAQQRSAIEALARDPRVNIPLEQIFGNERLAFNPGNVGQPPPNANPNPNATTPPGGGGGVSLDTPIRVGPDGRYIVGQ